MTAFTESVVEEAALEWFEALGYVAAFAPSLGPGEPGQERRTHADVVLEGRLREALARLNPTVSQEGLDEAFRRLTRIASPRAVDANRELHCYLVNGVSVECLRADGTIGYDPVRVVDFDEVESNDWLVVNQLTVSEGCHNRRPDLVVFLNGLPIAVIELKNAASENATVWNAFQQLQTYKQELPSLFAAAGLKNPDLSILSEQFLADVRGMKHRNLAVELLRKLLNDEVKARSKHNLVQARSFAELLEKSVLSSRSSRSPRAPKSRFPLTLTSSASPSRSRRSASGAPARGPPRHLQAS